MPTFGSVRRPEMACSDVPVGSTEESAAPPSEYKQKQKQQLGEGEKRYTNGSSAQTSPMTSFPLPGLSEGLETVTLPSGGDTVVLVDLGSSLGPSCVDTFNLIVNTLRLRVPKSISKRDTEFHCYFNDLPSNDFNSFFRLNSVREAVSNNFFVAGIPGSFYGRLFPGSYVHVFYSATCLHWLSKIPDAVLDKDSPAYNGANPWILQPRSAVAAAYKEQASLDLTKFLRAREAELYQGGLLFLAFIGRPCLELNDPANLCPFSEFISKDLPAIWNDLISEGFLKEEQREAFNVPVYLRSIEEVKEDIQSCGASFQVVTLTTVKMGKSPEELWPGCTNQEMSIKLANRYKAILGDLLQANMPRDVWELFWQRYEKIAEKKLASKRHIELTSTWCTVSLIKI